MKTVACRIDLGYTRIAGYTLFDSETLEFQETTPREVEKLIRRQLVNGLTLDEDGNVIPDYPGWNLHNMKIKSGVGNYRDYDMKYARGPIIYSVVRVINTAAYGRIFEVISNMCARTLCTEEQVRVLADLGIVGGINVDGKYIQECKGVVIENLNHKTFIEVSRRLTNEELKEDLMKEWSADPEETNKEAQEVQEDEVGEGEISEQIKDKGLEELFKGVPGFNEQTSPDEVGESVGSELTSEEQPTLPWEFNGEKPEGMEDIENPEGKEDQSQGDEVGTAEDEGEQQLPGEEIGTAETPENPEAPEDKGEQQAQAEGEQPQVEGEQPQVEEQVQDGEQPNMEVNHDIIEECSVEEKAIVNVIKNPAEGEDHDASEEKDVADGDQEQKQPEQVKKSKETGKHGGKNSRHKK